MASSSKYAGAKATGTNAKAKKPAPKKTVAVPNATNQHILDNLNSGAVPMGDLLPPSVAAAVGAPAPTGPAGSHWWDAPGAQPSSDSVDPSSTLAALLAASDQGSAPSYLAAPNHDSYLAPYVAAEGAAHKSYDAAVPALHQLYAQLQGNLSAANQDYTGAVHGLEQERSGQMDQRLAELAAPQVSQAAALVDGGQAAHMASDAQAGNVNRLKATFDAERSRDSRLDHVDAQAATARAQDAQTAEQSSLGTAQNNLNNVLAQIGLSKATAERQYQSDVNQTTKANNQIKSQQGAAAQTQLQHYLQLQQALAKQSTSTGRQRFEKQINDQGIGSTKYPKAFAVFQDIVGAAGKGAAGKQKALRILHAGDAQSGKYELKDGSVIANRLDASTLEKWINDWYDDTPSVDPEAFAQAGGDPTALQYIGGDNTDPALAAALIRMGH